MLYRRKPEIVDARELKLEKLAEVKMWIKAELFSQGVDLCDCGLILTGPRGKVTVFWGDYIVKEITGQFNVFSPWEFEKLYDMIKGPIKL
jgi:hypothetical protein